MKRSDVTGVLLMAYGTPTTPEEILPYYTHIRRGNPPPPELLQELQERYALIGGQTPLTEITENTRRGLEEGLNAGDSGRFRVIMGMKHWTPWIHEAIEQMADEGIDRAIGLVLAPHYSGYSIGQYYGYVDKAQEKLGTDIEIVRIDSWHLHPPYLEAVARRVRSGLEQFPPNADVTVVFTAHSLPQKIVAAGDPYPAQLTETAEAIARMLDLQHWTFSYQSAGRTADPWLGPDLVDTVNALAEQGVRNILVATIGFVSDHLEILYDIDYEARMAAKALDVTLKRTDSLNASPDFVHGLATLVLSRVGDLVIAPH
ncbi:MAG: ferrochelatase [Chloroflexota bacterium]